MTQIQIKARFGSGVTVDDGIAKLAAECAVRNSKSTEDALLLLDMLGLIPPQTPVVILQKDRLTPERKEARKRAREARIAREKAKIKDLDLLPHEIGE